MKDTIDKKKVTIEEATDSKSLKKLKTKELERMLETLLCDMSDNDATVNTIIAELLKRGVSKEEVSKVSEKGKEKIKKAFEALNIDASIDFIEKSTKGKHWKLENGKRVYNGNPKDLKGGEGNTAENKFNELSGIDKLKIIDSELVNRFDLHEDASTWKYELMNPEIKNRINHYFRNANK
jgi:hypothetical protein